MMRTGMIDAALLIQSDLYVLDKLQDCVGDQCRGSEGLLSIPIISPH
jgi:hypothetical protein